MPVWKQQLPTAPGIYLARGPMIKVDVHRIEVHAVAGVLHARDLDALERARERGDADFDGIVLHRLERWEWAPGGAEAAA